MTTVIPAQGLQSQILAAPLQAVKTIFENKVNNVAQQAARLAHELEAEEIVVGMPKNMNNTSGERAEKTEEFIKQLGQLTDIKIVRWDERLSTVCATKVLNQTNVRGKKRKNIIDTVAAEFILQSYLDYKKNLKGAK